jgi:hypothetical protein
VRGAADEPKGQAADEDKFIRGVSHAIRAFKRLPRGTIGRNWGFYRRWLAPMGMRSGSTAAGISVAHGRSCCRAGKSEGRRPARPGWLGPITGADLKAA